MNQLTDFDRRYINLILDINKHIDGYIDAYIGPDQMKMEADVRPSRPPASLAEDVAQLWDKIPIEDPARHTYLGATLRAVETTIQILNGQDIPYMEEVQRIYDIMPQRVDEDVFLQAHKELDTHLPGTGPLPSRFETWRSQYNIPNKKLRSALRMASKETRKRTQALIDLPIGETIQIKLVRGQPWSAYNWFKGHGHSLIEFNTDIPNSALSLLSVFAHEGYPGHHTEAILKEQRYWRRRRYGEAASMLLHSPAAVIAEGIATTAVEIIFPDQEYLQWTLETLLPSIPMQAHESVEQLGHIQKAMLQLQRVTGNAALLFHTGQHSREQTVEYLQTNGLISPNRVEKSISFITHPLFRSYPFTYIEGYDLISKAAGAGDKRDVFLKCLTGQVLPSQLAAQGAKNAR